MPPPRSRDLPPPRRREVVQVQVPEFDRESLQTQKELILLEVTPVDVRREIRAEGSLCELLRKSAANHERIVRGMEEFAKVTAKSGDFIAGSSEASSAAKNAEVIRGDLEGRYQFVSRLTKGVTGSVCDFFSV